MDGTILFWDTNRMQPVFRATPFESISAVHLQPGGGHLIAAGSWQDRAVKLVDLRSGACSHHLVGHDDVISSVEWSPTSSVVLASGSRNGEMRLWDIRKAGSRSCITVLHGEAPIPNVATAYSADYSHLRVSSKKNGKLPKSAPNNYTLVQSRGYRAHHGSVSALSFFPDGHFLSSVGSDGELLLWDLRDGRMVQSKFVAPGGHMAAGSATGTPQMRRKVPLCIDQDNDTIWVGNKAQLMAYSSREGGSPKQILKGHLHDLTAVQRMDQSLQLVTAAEDGMILAWGRRPRDFSRKRARLQDQDNW
jgi:WD40 repeat protein